MSHARFKLLFVVLLASFAWLPREASAIGPGGGDGPDVPCRCLCDVVTNACFSEPGQPDYCYTNQCPLGCVGGCTTAKIVVTGNNTTPMPCSWTGSLRERYYDIEVRATITYLDQNCQEKVYHYRNAKNCEVGALHNGGFTFTFLAAVPGAKRILKTVANARVISLQAYGIHGWTTITRDGSGTGSCEVNVPTTTTGFQCAVPGAASFCDPFLFDPPPGGVPQP